MKKLVFLFIAATLLVALLPAVVSATGDDGGDHDYCTRLIAGGGGKGKSAIKVGWVCVDEVNGDLVISYQTSPGWCLTETHLHIADSLAGIPQTQKNNPIPGQFGYSTMNQCTRDINHIVPFDAAPAYIAAHAVVCKCDCGDKCSYTKCDCSYECECSGECETAWGAGTRFNPKNWATYFTYPPLPE
jgi:hypothetical protein